MRPGEPGRLSYTLALLAVGLELLVSSNLLTWTGVPYVTDGGILLFKFHPGTLLLEIACLAGCVTAGSSWLGRLDATLASFLAFSGFCVVYAFAMTGPGNLIVLLDTFLPAGLLCALLSHAPLATLLRLRRVMQAALVLNAAIAIIEAACQSTLVPLYLNDAAYHPHSEDFRPTALFDHPLTGALMMMIGLAIAPRGRCRRAYQAVIWAALIAFSGRMAMVVSGLGALAVALSTHASALLRRERQAVQTAMLALAGLGAGALLAAIALSAGLGGRLVGHLYWDDSAQVRLAQWQILDRLDTWQWIFGMQREVLLANLNMLRLSSGVEVIENFWLLMFVGLGLVGFPLFLAMFGSLCLWCWRRSGRDGRLLMLGVLLVASSSNSLGRKSTVLVCLVAAICSMQRVHTPRRAGHTQRSGAPHWHARRA